jgi:hypothetical protein
MEGLLNFFRDLFCMLVIAICSQMEGCFLAAAHVLVFSGIVQTLAFRKELAHLPPATGT